MHPNLPKLLIFLLLLSCFSVTGQELIWQESFSVPDKGIWGDDDGTTVHVDFDKVTTWSLDYGKVSLANADDYAKTVSTSGGRFECRDINGEVTWTSEVIDISAYKDVKIQLTAKETGSGKNEANKYLKAYYKLDDGDMIQFELDAVNVGNWGENKATQSGLLGESLQIVVLINNHYASDKVILDEVTVSGEERNPVVVEQGDVLINEVLFNPVDDGADYVELYNYSDKQIPLNKLFLASRDKDMELTQVYVVTSEKVALESQSYLALTKDTSGVFPYFNIECTACFWQMDKFPSYNNDEDYVVLLNNDLEIIDEFHYTEDLHLPLFYDVEGIALERISFSEETNNEDNWHSASTNSGGGTPGYENSQSDTEIGDNISVSFQPQAISPNGDGYNDTYSISIQLEGNGYFANIWIFDLLGRKIVQLADNFALGTSDEIIWNGQDENGNRIKIGGYVVFAEIFDLNGNVKRFKDGVVLTDVFE